MPLEGADAFWKSATDQLLDLAHNDPIHECFPDGIGDTGIFNQADRLLNLADQKLHTFPFKDVRPCWFRMYTDASVAKVLNLVERKHQLAKGPANVSFDDHFDEIVSLLDMALIMAGGMGREELIQDIFAQLQPVAKRESSVYGRPAKKRRLNATSKSETLICDLLPVDTVSVPKLEFPVKKLHSPSITEFLRFMQEKKEPAVMTSVLEHWPALENWRSASFWLEATLDGRRLVPIEVGRSYTDEEWGQRIVPFRDFLSHYIQSPAGCDLVHESAAKLQTGYLAQHDLFKQIPTLRHDVAIPDYCYLDAPPAEPGTPVALTKAKAGKNKKMSHPSTIPSTNQSLRICDDMQEADSDDEPQMNIWFGPSWTISPLHHDPYHNILCQVVGKKYVRLYAPCHSQALLPKCENEPAPHLAGQEDAENQDKKGQTDGNIDTIDMSNTSQIDVAAMELSPSEDWSIVYPGIAEIPYVECVLEAGEALYIPIGWWHYVRSCSVGISVSFWW